MKMWIRIGFLIISLILAILCIIFDCPEYVDMVGAVSVLASSIICAWKNNDFTKAAKIGSEIMHSIKDGKVTEEEIEKILSEVENGDK